MALSVPELRWDVVAALPQAGGGQQVELVVPQIRDLWCLIGELADALPEHRFHQ